MPTEMEIKNDLGDQESYFTHDNPHTFAAFYVG